LTETDTQHLLQLAGAPPSDKQAAAWLSNAIEGARAIHRAAKRPRPADHNDLLADIEKSAKQLTNRIKRLRRHPFSLRAFWRSSVFGPVYLNRFEVREVMSSLEDIVRAADGAKDLRKGRRREVGKQQVVDLAFAFFVRFSSRTPSGTRTGAFAKFAHAFYVAATGKDFEEHGGLDRQIREAMKRLPIERQRAQRKSVEKPRVSS
jgi:hypothetical protein